MATKEKKSTNEERLTVGALRQSCIKIFGCSTAVFDGAMATKSKTEKYTREEIKSFIKDFLSKRLGG